MTKRPTAMRFPFSLTSSMTAYLARKKWSGAKRFPLVLMLEPLHACNLSCAGCGRIREYADTVHERLSVDQCLAAVEQCGAPIVSVCGGEPLIYPEIDKLVERLIARKKHVYLCTNGVLLEKKLSAFRPSSRLQINVHLDGPAATHDRLVEREGVFDAAIRGIEAARDAGFLVCTNTTVYKQTDMREIVGLFSQLTKLGVGGLMISPAFGYAAVRDEIFMTRDEVREKFREAEPSLSQFQLTATPIYMEFLCGRRELPCAAWANPTYNVRGWRGPCYLLGDAHYTTYNELIESTDWDRCGPGGDPRCEHCLVHCGFEPAAVLLARKTWGDVARMIVWQMT